MHYTGLLKDCKRIYFTIKYLSIPRIKMDVQKNMGSQGPDLISTVSHWCKDLWVDTRIAKWTKSNSTPCREKGKEASSHPLSPIKWKNDPSSSGKAAYNGSSCVWVFLWLVYWTRTSPMVLLRRSIPNLQFQNLGTRINILKLVVVKAGSLPEMDKSASSSNKPLRRTNSFLWSLNKRELSLTNYYSCIIQGHLPILINLETFIRRMSSTDKKLLKVHTKAED